MNRTTLLHSVLVLLLCLVAGCLVGPDYQRPTTPVDPNLPRGYLWVPEGWQEPNEPSHAQQWWNTFGDPFVDQLVQDVLQQNTDLRAATANVRRAEAVVRQVHGLRWPTVNYSADAAGTRTGFDASFLPGGGFVSNYSQSYSHGFNVSYAMDVFGRLRRGERASVAELQALAEDREALAYTLVAVAIDLRIQLATAHKQARIAAARVATWQRSVEIIGRRYEGGVGSPVDLYLARQRLAQSRAARSQIEEIQTILGHGLDVLRGRLPQPASVAVEALPHLPPLDPVPVGLPAHLLARRPDLRAAERRVAAATERIGERTAERYPDLTLGFSLGFNNNEFDRLLDWKFRTVQHAAQLSAPIFAGGRLKAGVEAARAEADGAIQHYVGAVLNAVKEVEDALVRSVTLTEQLTHHMDQWKQATEAERLATDRYVQGVDGLLVVLESERQRREAEFQIAATEGALWQNRVALFLALGGDWGLPGYSNVDPGDTSL